MTDQTATVLPYADANERRIAKAIVRDALANGWTVSVYDGEEWVIKHSANAQATLLAMGSTDMDRLAFRKDERTIGVVDLVWGNGEDLISDHSDNEAMAAFMDNRY